MTQITGAVNMGNVAKTQDIKEWTTGAYDADVLFTYPDGIYAGDSTVSVKVILKDAATVSGDSVSENKSDEGETKKDE